LQGVFALYLKGGGDNHLERLGFVHGDYLRPRGQGLPIVELETRRVLVAVDQVVYVRRSGMWRGHTALKQGRT
jgi:hypothetical protein